MSFECTEAGIDRLIYHMDVYASLAIGVQSITNLYENSARRLPNYMGWVEQNIPCEGDGIITRDYLNDASIGGLPGLQGVRCPTATLTASS